MTYRNTSWNAPYTFSGKEKDAETGYGYFGARYYDSGLSIWFFVDPMSDKYPSMSPYNYCTNNPVILVDLDGREIWIHFGNNIRVKYKEGVLYDASGEICKNDGSDAFLNNVVTALDKIRTGSNLGKKMIDRISNDPDNKILDIKAGNKTEVNEKKKSSETDLISKTLFFITEGTDQFVLGTDIPEKKGVADLAHELSHAYDDYTKSWLTGNIKGLDNIEWQACYRENCIRVSLGFPLRSHYRSVSFNGDKFPMAPELLDADGVPKNPKNF